MTALGTPYRLGATSYVWPADLPSNVRHLGSLVDDIELILFDLDDQSNLPDLATTDELRALAQTYDLSYTVHLPLDLGLDRPLAFEKARAVVDCTRALDPWAYVMHLDGVSVAHQPAEKVLAGWRRDAAKVLYDILRIVDGICPLCVENLENYAPEAFLPLLNELPIELCIDIGHLWMTGRDPVSFLENHLDRTHVLHLHGFRRQGHESLEVQGIQAVAPIVRLLERRDYRGVLTLEVFGQDDFFGSRNLVMRIVNENV